MAPIVTAGIEKPVPSRLKYNRDQFALSLRLVGLDNLIATGLTLMK